MDLMEQSKLIAVLMKDYTFKTINTWRSVTAHLPVNNFCSVGGFLYLRTRPTCYGGKWQLMTSAFFAQTSKHSCTLSQTAPTLSNATPGVMTRCCITSSSTCQAADMLRNDKICMLLQKRQESDIKELDKQINEFRKRYQAPEDRREFDIYDPDGKKKDKPARISDEDPRCGVSSMQRFLGENLNEKTIRKLQQEEHREWAKQQMAERQQELANLKQAERLYDLKAIENDQRTVELTCAEQDCRKAINMAVKDYNLALAQERKSKEDIDKRKELEDNLTEKSNQIYGDMLTENPDVAQSAFGSHRVITGRWKGMTPSELQCIRMVQAHQMQENQKKKDFEKQQKKEWDDLTLNNAHAAKVLEQENERQRKYLMKKQAEENLMLAAVQKTRLEHMNKEVYANQPTAAFFMQFNTTSR